MADWIIPCNPEYYDVFTAFQKLESIDWRHSAKSILPGDTVYIYVGKPVHAVAFRCVVTETMIPPEWADFSDTVFEKGDSLEPYAQYMRLKLEKWIPPGAITYEKMCEAGMKGHIQGPRTVPDELKELFHSAQQSGKSSGTAAVSVPEPDRSMKDTSNRQKDTADQYGANKQDV